MSIQTNLTDIDSEPTPAERQAAQQLLDAEMPTDTSMHASLPALPALNPTAAMAIEYERLASGADKEGGVDTTRYEALDAPSGSDSSTQWRAALQQAHISHTYLRSRQTNLSLLEKYGKNAWLISNSQLEAQLGAVERELALTKEAVDVVVVQRKNAQEGVAGELQGLAETWKRGVGRVLETEIAAENVRREILERRRAAA